MCVGMYVSRSEKWFISSTRGTGVCSFSLFFSVFSYSRYYLQTLVWLMKKQQKTALWQQRAFPSPCMHPLPRKTFHYTTSSRSKVKPPFSVCLLLRLPHFCQAVLTSLFPYCVGLILVTHDVDFVYQKIVMPVLHVRDKDQNGRDKLFSVRLWSLNSAGLTAIAPQQCISTAIAI